MRETPCKTCLKLVDRAENFTDVSEGICHNAAFVRLKVDLELGARLKWFTLDSNDISLALIEGRFLRLLNELLADLPTRLASFQ